MPMYVDKFKSGTWKQGLRGGDGIDASWVDPSVDLWTENENIFDRSERSPLLFTDAAAAETFFKAVPCDAMPSPLLSPAAAAWPPGPIRGDHQFRRKE